MTATKTNYQKCISALIKYPQLLDEFVAWYKDGQWDDEDLTTEFTEDIEDCSFIDSMKENNKIKTETQALEIWQILHNAITLIKEIAFANIESCIDGSDCDRDRDRDEYKNDSVIVKLLSIDIKYKEKKKYIESKSSPIRKRLKKQSPMILPPKTVKTHKNKHKKEQQNTAYDILYVEYIGYKNDNLPLLLYFVDSYVRCQLNEWVITGHKNRVKYSTSTFFETRCNNLHFKQFYSHKDGKRKINFIETAINSYQSRVLLPFQCMEPAWKINDINPLATANYIFEMARIVRRVSNVPIYNCMDMIPTQIDFMIVNSDIEFNKPNKYNAKGIDQLFDSDSDTDDDDLSPDEHNENESKHNNNNNNNNKQDISDNIEQLLTSKKIKYHTYDSTSRWVDAIKHMKELNENQRAKRNIFVLDRRKKHIKMDRLYLFKPKEYNKFEKNTHDLVHGALHHNSIKSMLPRDGRKKTQDFGVRDSLAGQMFVMSYHILAKDEIRCYVFYQGQCFRFYGEDLINILPIFFKHSESVRQRLLSKYNWRGNGKPTEWQKQFDEFRNTFNDKKFDSFYYGLTGKKPRTNVRQKKK